MNKIFDNNVYIQDNLGQAMASRLSKVLDNKISHNQVKYMLNNIEYHSNILWQKVKSLVGYHESTKGCLIFDDTIQYTDNNIFCWHYYNIEYSR